MARKGTLENHTMVVAPGELKCSPGGVAVWIQAGILLTRVDFQFSLGGDFSASSIS